MTDDFPNPQAPDKPHPRYTTKAERRRRIEQLFPLVVAGVRRSDIMQFCATKTNWGCAERTIDYYVAEANKLLEAESHTHRAVELGRSLRRLNMLHAKCVTAEDYSTALGTLREINALLGLHAAKEMGVDQVRHQTLTQDQIDALDLVADIMVGRVRAVEATVVNVPPTSAAPEPLKQIEHTAQPSQEPSADGVDESGGEVK